MPEHSRNYIMHAAKSVHGTFSRPRAIPTYLPTYLSILLSTAKAICDATYFPKPAPGSRLFKFFQTTYDYMLSLLPLRAS